MTDLADAIDTAVDTDPLMLRDALLAVLGLHRETQAQATYGDKRPCCAECYQFGMAPEWPCKTRAAIARAVGA